MTSPFHPPPSLSLQPSTFLSLSDQFVSELSLFSGDDWASSAFSVDALHRLIAEIDFAERSRQDGPRGGGGVEGSTDEVSRSLHRAFIHAVTTEVMRVRQFTLDKCACCALELNGWLMAVSAEVTSSQSTVFAAAMSEAFADLVCQLYPVDAVHLLPHDLYTAAMRGEEAITSTPYYPFLLSRPSPSIPVPFLPPLASSTSPSYLRVSSLLSISRCVDHLRRFILLCSMLHFSVLQQYEESTTSRPVECEQALFLLKHEPLSDSAAIGQLVQTLGELIGQLAHPSTPSNASPTDLYQPPPCWSQCACCSDRVEVSPVSLSCLHSFCFPSLLRAIAQSGGQCWACGDRPLTMKEIAIDTLYTTLVQSRRINLMASSLPQQPLTYHPHHQHHYPPHSPSQSSLSPSPTSTSSPHVGFTPGSSSSTTSTTSGSSPALLDPSLLDPSLLAPSTTPLTPSLPEALALFSQVRVASPSRPPPGGKKRKQSNVSASSLTSSRRLRAVRTFRSASSSNLTSLPMQGSVVSTSQAQVVPVQAEPVAEEVVSLYVQREKSAEQAVRGEAEVAAWAMPSLPPSPLTLSPALLASYSSASTSCHQCKTTKRCDELRHCSCQVEVGGGRMRKCRKKYCESCIMGKGYEEGIKRVTLAWQCPACLSMCKCAACTRKNKSKGDQHKSHHINNNNNDQLTIHPEGGGHVASPVSLDDEDRLSNSDREPAGSAHIPRLVLSSQDRPMNNADDCAGTMRSSFPLPLPSLALATTSSGELRGEKRTRRAMSPTPPHFHALPPPQSDVSLPLFDRTSLPATTTGLVVMPPSTSLCSPPLVVTSAAEVCSSSAARLPHSSPLDIVKVESQLEPVAFTRWWNEVHAAHERGRGEAVGHPTSSHDQPIALHGSADWPHLTNRHSTAVVPGTAAEVWPSLDSLTHPTLP